MFYLFKTTATDSFTLNGFWTMDLVIFKLVVRSRAVCTAIPVAGLGGGRRPAEKGRAMDPSLCSDQGEASHAALALKTARETSWILLSFWKLGQGFATWRQTCTGHAAREGPGGSRERLVPGRACCPPAGGFVPSEAGGWGGTGPRGEEPWLNPGSHHGSFPPGFLGMPLLPRFLFTPSLLGTLPRGILLSPHCQDEKQTKCPSVERLINSSAAIQWNIIQWLKRNELSSDKMTWSDVTALS